MGEQIWREERIKQQEVIQEKLPFAKKLLDELPGEYPAAHEVIDQAKHMSLTFTRNILQDVANQIDAYVTLVDKERDAVLGLKAKQPELTNVKGRGYRLIEAGVTSPWVALSGDAQVRCLSYLLLKIDKVLAEPLGILHLDKFAAVPQGVFFEIIPIQYHHEGAPYPGIGMYADTNIHPKVLLKYDLDGLTLAIDEKLKHYLRKVKLDSLLELSAHEPVSWEGILTKFGMLDWLPGNGKTKGSDGE